jgi:hypothetical protein
MSCPLLKASTLLSRLQLLRNVAIDSVAVLYRAKQQGRNCVAV